MSSFLERQYWGLPCFLGWLNLKFDISKKQKMMHRSFQTLNLQPILHLKITSSHLLSLYFYEDFKFKTTVYNTSVFIFMGLFKTLTLSIWDWFYGNSSLVSGCISACGFHRLSLEFVGVVLCLFCYISWWPKTKCE